MVNSCTYICRFPLFGALVVRVRVALCGPAVIVYTFFIRVCASASIDLRAFRSPAGLPSCWAMKIAELHLSCFPPDCSVPFPSDGWDVFFVLHVCPHLCHNFVCMFNICLDHREAARAGDEVRGHGGVPSGRHGSDVLRRPRDRLRLHFPGARVAKGMHHRGTACLCLDIRVYFLRSGSADGRFLLCIRTVLVLGVSSCFSSGQGKFEGLGFRASAAANDRLSAGDKITSAFALQLSSRVLYCGGERLCR